MKQGAMMTVLSTLVAALALPATLITASDLIDSKWAIAVDRLVIFCFVFCFYFWPREDPFIDMEDIGN